MLYVQSFSLPGEGREWSFLEKDPENRRTCYGSRYPFGVFQNKGISKLELEPITILCGGNGSGKTTLLNLIGEKLALQRGAVFNRSSFYGSYLDMCRAETTPGQQPGHYQRRRVRLSAGPALHERKH